MTSTFLWLVPLILLAVLIVFPIFWCLVVGLLSIVGGWRRLAERFSANQNLAAMATGETRRWQSGTVGAVRYRNALTLTPTPTGIFMQPMWAFRFAHPRLFIPWHELHNAEEHEFLLRQIQAEVGVPAITTLRLPTAVVEEYVSLPM